MATTEPDTQGRESAAAARWPAGPVTGVGAADSGGTGLVPTPTTPGTAGASGGPPAGPSRGPGNPLWWFAGGAAVVLVIGLVIVAGLVRSGDGDPSRSSPQAAPDTRSELARRCPPPTSVTPPGPPPAPAEPVQPGQARTVDQEAGISYAAYGSPWQPWTVVWNAGELRVPYRAGQHFVTEPSYDGFSDYHAAILSAAVPAAENDALTFDLECVGRQIVADVRAEYHPQPNEMQVISDGRTTLGGRPAWVSQFRLSFSKPGLVAKDELVAVACIDVGRSTAAVLYVSIPGTHRQFDWVVADTLASVRPL